MLEWARTDREHPTVLCVIVHAVLPFRVEFRPGVPLCEQIVYAATKAMISGDLRPGDPFPSVRLLGRELKINPNTAHKVVAQLISSGLLETRPGIGTVVAALPEARRVDKTQLLGHEIEQLAVEAKRLGIPLDAILDSVSAHWKKLGGGDAGKSESDRGGRGRK